MAASSIKVSVEQMESAVSAYESNNARQQTALDQMKGAVEGLQGVWKGGAGDAFRNAFAALHANLKTSDVHMQDAIEELKQSAGLFRQTEEDGIKGQISGLDAGSAFQL